jgi:hypothetical protein
MKNITFWKSLCESDSIEMLVNMSENLQGNDYEFEEISPQVLIHITLISRASLSVAVET